MADLIDQLEEVITDRDLELLAIRSANGQYLVSPEERHFLRVIESGERVDILLVRDVPDAFPVIGYVPPRLARRLLPIVCDPRGDSAVKVPLILAPSVPIEEACDTRHPMEAECFDLNAKRLVITFLLVSEDDDEVLGKVTVDTCCDRGG